MSNKYNLYSMVNIDGEMIPVIGSSNMAKLMNEKGHSANRIKIKSFNSLTELIKYDYFIGDVSMHDLLLLTPCYRSYVSLCDIKTLLEYSGDDDIINDVIEKFGYISKIYNDQPTKPAEVEEVEGDKEYCEYTIYYALRTLYNTLYRKGYCSIIKNEAYILATEANKSDIDALHEIISHYDGYYFTENANGMQLRTQCSEHDAMEKDLYDELMKWVGNLPDISGNKASDEECNDAECNDMVKMFDALRQRIDKKDIILDAL